MKKLNFRKILISVLIGFVATALLLFVSSAVLCFTSVPEKYADAFVIASVLMGVIIAGALSAIGEASSGWLRGGITGVLYMAFLSIARMFFSENTDIIKTLIFILSAFLAGSIGGITGINIKLQKKRK